MTTPPVFLVDPLPAGDHTVLDGPEGHHAATVRRLTPGEQLILCDGKGNLARCRVESAGRDTLDLAVLDRRSEPAPQPRVIIAQALIKGDRGELAVELATEAGADMIIPWRAQRSIARWDDGPRGAKALARWRATAREAAKQARRAWIPTVTEPVTSTGLADRVRDSAATLLLDSSAKTPLTEAKLPLTDDLIVIIGPEGGVAPTEVDQLERSGAQLVRLGPTVLRASTAAAVAVAAIGVLSGRWR